jgi:hypothetical protein
MRPPNFPLSDLLGIVVMTGRSWTGKKISLLLSSGYSIGEVFLQRPKTGALSGLCDIGSIILVKIGPVLTSYPYILPTDPGPPAGSVCTYYKASPSFVVDYPPLHRPLGLAILLRRSLVILGAASSTSPAREGDEWKGGGRGDSREHDVGYGGEADGRTNDL